MSSLNYTVDGFGHKQVASRKNTDLSRESSSGHRLASPVPVSEYVSCKHVKRKFYITQQCIKAPYTVYTSTGLISIFQHLSECVSVTRRVMKGQESEFKTLIQLREGWIAECPESVIKTAIKMKGFLINNSLN